VTFETQHLSNEYAHLPSHHSGQPAEYEVSDPIFVNPSSHHAVAQVLRTIGKRSKIKKYCEDGDREWLIVVCDGLPFTHAAHIIEKYATCQECDESVMGAEELVKHRETVHSGSANFDKEFDWVIIQPGPGHIEMQMLKSFVKFSWDIFWESMIEIYGFKSPIAKAAALKVNDHHKGWTLLRITREAMAKELFVPYVRKCLTENLELSTSNFMNFARNNVKDPNYSLIGDLVLNIIPSIFCYREGVRTGDVERMKAGRGIFSKMWFARNHPMYRELEVYDSLLRLCMPQEVLKLINATMSINLSGQKYTGEGPDFKLEAVNRVVQRSLPAVPSGKDWMTACVNYHQLKELKKNTLLEAGLRDEENRLKTYPKIEDQVDAFRVLIRQKEYLSTPSTEKTLTSLTGVELDPKLVNFARDATKNRKDFIDNFLVHVNTEEGVAQTKSVPYLPTRICITKTERMQMSVIANKTIKEIDSTIETLLNQINDTEVQETFKAQYKKTIVGKKVLKAVHVEFANLLCEYVDNQPIPHTEMSNELNDDQFS
jgi:hypothetical protein